MNDTKKNIFLPRILYVLAVFAFVLLLWPNPVTVFMAACLSCLTLPLFRYLHHKVAAWRNRPGGNPFVRFLQRISGPAPVLAYTCIICSAILIPIAILVLLVAPQAGAGYARLKQLTENNFQLPAEWVEKLNELSNKLSEYPLIAKPIAELRQILTGLLNDATANLDNMGVLLGKISGFLGGTMAVLWTMFLFLTLAVLFSAYSGHIKKATCRIFHLAPDLVERFVCTNQRALRGIMLGIVLVALVQGFLCGIGFAVAGVNQPAFWGMLATLVAPIPVVGTAIVWLPLCLSLWFTGKTMAATGLALWGMLAVAGVDNVLRPLFLRQGINAPFFVLILAILCGMASFGTVGLIAGPVLLAFALQAVEEANAMYNSHG